MKNMKFFLILNTLGQVPVLGGDKDTCAADGLEVWGSSACAGSVSSVGSMGEQRQSGIGDRMIFSQHRTSSKSSRCFSGTKVLAWYQSTCLLVQKYAYWY